MTADNAPRASEDEMSPESKHEEALRELRRRVEHEKYLRAKKPRDERGRLRRGDDDALVDYWNQRRAE